MYPAPFEYYRAESVTEAISLLQQHGPDAKLIAGGHSLLPMMKMRLAQPAVLVDLSRVIGLSGFQELDNGGLRIGAMTPYVQIANNEGVRIAYGALADACAIIGDVQVRNRGTIGGNLAHSDPASDLPAVALALDATFHVEGPGGARTVRADDWFVDLMQTALGDDEILVAVDFPRAQGPSAYAKFENPASGYAICGVAARIGGGPARVAATGAFAHARRLSGAEAALPGEGSLEASLAAAASRAAEGFDADDYLSDIHADAAYRAHLLEVLTARALRSAISRAVQ